MRSEFRHPLFPGLDAAMSGPVIDAISGCINQGRTGKDCVPLCFECIQFGNLDEFGLVLGYRISLAEDLTF